jgi:replicative DNA helicase
VSKQSANNKLQDIGIENSVIAGILQHGPDCLLDVEEIISPNDFYWRHNQTIFSILQYLVKDKNIKEFDIPSIISACVEKSYEISKNLDPTELLEALFDQKISSIENTKKLAIVIYKLSITRKAIKSLDSAEKDLYTITGQENINDIIARIEDPVLSFTSKLLMQDKEMRPMCDDFVEALKALAETPQDMVGIPTGYSKWDSAIGGGLRRGTVNVVAARPKVGKSFFCINVARNVAENNIPVLYLDTELSRLTQMNRLISLTTSVELEKIETGKFANSDIDKKKIWEMRDYIKGLQITHCSVAGQNVQNGISIARRWLTKCVGFNDNGQANPCLLIYDYLKLTNMDQIKHNTQEHQLLGFLISSLHDFAMQWGIPILATVQSNREGGEKDGGQYAAGSDRFLWLGSNFSMLKRKNQKEAMEDPFSNGSKKLIVTDTRYGEGMEEDEYINIIDELKIAKLQEGQTRREAIAASFPQNEEQ